MTPIRHLPRLRLPIVAIVLLLAAAGSAFAQAPAPSANPELAPAVKLLREGETLKALELLKRAVKKNKTDGEAWYYLGIVYLQLSDLKKASEAFKTAITVRPDLAAPAHAGYAYALMLRNRLDTAVLEANKALAIDPQNIEALYTLGLVDLRKGARNEAIKRATALIALQPEFAPAYLLMSQAHVSYSGGAMYRDSNEPKDQRHLRYKSAADALEKYLKLETDPAEAQAWEEQLETLRFYVASSSGETGIYTGGDVTTKVRIIAKPEPSYTEKARQENVVGRVVLRCVFAADGSVKHILVLQSLPNGLTERCIAAAKKIKFTPATLNGKAVSMWMQLEYNFNLY